MIITSWLAAVWLSAHLEVKVKQWRKAQGTKHEGVSD